MRKKLSNGFKAKAIASNRRVEYNADRYHSSLNNMSPEEFLTKHAELTKRKTAANFTYEWYRKMGMVKRVLHL